MIVFDEPGDGFELEKSKELNIKTKIRVISLFIVFLLMIIFIVKNDFKLDFWTKKNAFEPVCGPKNTANPTDDDEEKTEKAGRVILSNEENFKKSDGFEKSFLSQEPIGYKGRNLPVINLSFNKVSESHSRIPEEICGFKVRLVY